MSLLRCWDFLACYKAPTGALWASFQYSRSSPFTFFLLLAPTGALWASFQHSRSSPFILSWKCERGLLWFEKVFAGNCSGNPSIYLFCRHRWHPIQGLISVSQIFKYLKQFWCKYLNHFLYELFWESFQWCDLVIHNFHSIHLYSTQCELHPGEKLSKILNINQRSLNTIL